MVLRDVPGAVAQGKGHLRRPLQLDEAGVDILKRLVRTARLAQGQFYESALRKAALQMLQKSFLGFHTSIKSFQQLMVESLNKAGFFIFCSKLLRYV